MATLDEKIKKAREAGYSDEEISKFLGTKVATGQVGGGGSWGATSNFDKLRQIPILGSLLSPAINTTQDITTAAFAKKQQPYLDQREKQAQELEKQALTTDKPNMKQGYLKQAQAIRSEINENTQNISQSFSPDVAENPLWRGLKTGAAIATTAEIPEAIFNLSKAGLNLLKKPSQTVKALLKNPLPKTGAANKYQAVEEATQNAIAEAVGDSPLTTGGGKEILFEKGPNNIVNQIKEKVFDQLGSDREVVKAYGDFISGQTPTPQTITNAQGLPQMGNISLSPKEITQQMNVLKNKYGKDIFGKALDKSVSQLDLKIAQIAREVFSKNLHKIAPQTLEPDIALAIYNKLGIFGKAGLPGMLAEALLGKTVVKKGFDIYQSLGLQ